MKKEEDVSLEGSIHGLPLAGSTAPEPSISKIFSPEIYF